MIAYDGGVFPRAMRLAPTYFTFRRVKPLEHELDLGRRRDDQGKNAGQTEINGTRGTFSACSFISARCGVSV
jgi:hypothetical protein